MSISGKTSDFYVDNSYNGYNEKGVSFVVKNNASNVRYISDIDLSESFGLPNDLRSTRVNNKLSLSTLGIIFGLIAILVSIGYSYRHQASESSIAIKKILSSLTNTETITELKQTVNRFTNTVGNFVQRQKLSNSSADLIQSLRTVQNDTIAAGLENIGNRIILTNHWPSEDIVLFSTLWDLSDDKSRIKTTQSIWFQQFSFKLGRQANKLLIANDKNDPIIELTRKLGVTTTLVKKKSLSPYRYIR